MKYLSTESRPEDWQALLAQPERHWVRGRSAWELAHAWEGAKGFPPTVRAVLDGSGLPEFANLAIVEAHPEHKTPLPGGRRASQTDLWLLAANDRGRVSIGVEGKVDETFGPLVEEWGPDGTPGRAERLRYLTDLLGLSIDDSLDLRYQLLHRTAAAIIEAEGTGCAAALMLVHSFDPGHAGFEDYSRFVERLGGSGVKDGITAVRTHRYVGWVADRPSAIAE